MENVLLNEERGVAAFKYREVVDEIYNYITNEIEKLAKRFGGIPDRLNNSPIIVPQSIAEKLNFMFEPMIVCRINVHELEHSIEFGSGSFGTNMGGRLKDGKLMCGNGGIEIDLYCNKSGLVYKKSFYSTIYHEINHAYECYRALSSPSAMHSAVRNDFFGGVFGVTPMAIDVKQFSTDVSTKNEEIKADIEKIFSVYDTPGDNSTSRQFGESFRYLDYRIFSDTELDAQVAQVYGSLQAMDSKRENFKEDIKKTYAYEIAQNCNEFIESMAIMPDNLTVKIRDVFQKYGMKISRSNNPEKIRKDFINLLKYKKDRFMRGIGKAASLYYDSVEDKESIINEYKKSPFFGTKIIEGQLIHYDPPVDMKDLVIYELTKRLKDLNDR